MFRLLSNIRLSDPYLSLEPTKPKEAKLASSVGNTTSYTVHGNKMFQVPGNWQHAPHACSLPTDPMAFLVSCSVDDSRAQGAAWGGGLGPGVRLGGAPTAS